MQHGEKAAKTYEQVQAAIVSGLSAKDAFALVAGQIGSKPSTVRSNYYRENRRRGNVRRRRPPSREQINALVIELRAAREREAQARADVSRLLELLMGYHQETLDPPQQRVSASNAILDSDEVESLLGEQLGKLGR